MARGRYGRGAVPGTSPSRLPRPRRLGAGRVVPAAAGERARWPGSVCARRCHPQGGKVSRLGIDPGGIGGFYVNTGAAMSEGRRAGRVRRPSWGRCFWFPNRCPSG